VFFGILGTTEPPVGGPRARSLLALLLLNAGQIVSTERLIDGLYGEDPPSGAANPLQSQVSRLRRALPVEAGPEFHPAGYRLTVDPDQVDAVRFERLAREGQRALAAGEHARAATLLREALDLWRGPALADVTGAPFAAAQANRLDELRSGAIEDHAEAELSVGGYRGLVPVLQELTAAHPLRERARALLMRALYGSGRQAEALAVYEDARRTLADELGADPSPELAEVHLAVLRAEPSLTAEPTAVRSRLPAQLTSFVGRDDELERISKLLAAGRLVTLTGPGGTGKTRLAIEAAGREPDEVCFADLAPLAEGGEVPQAVLGALGLRETGLLPGAAGQPPDPVVRMIAALTNRRLLLILDNCEHVIDAAARLVHRLLGACPGLRVLATSREALGITGEAVCPLPPLALPPPGTRPLEALGYPAVRLFAERAAAVHLDFQVDTSNVEDVMRICDALDGLPLAIELAAARLRTLAVEDVAARLDDRFRLLSRGDRTKAPRHQTLRATVEWSWDLLDDAEQTLARRLTVFADGATPEAAAGVCGLSEGEVDELLASLADKSLVHGDRGRYRMLDTVRVFCAERLTDAAEDDRLFGAHLAYFLNLAETAEPYLLRTEQLEWLARLKAEHGNLIAALRWAVRADAVTALRLLASLASYWWLRGVRSEGAPPALDLLDRIGPEPPAGLDEEYIICVMIATYGGAVGPALQAHQERAEAAMAALGRPYRRPVAIVLRAMTTGPPPATDVELQLKLMGDDPWPMALRHFGFGYEHWFGGEPAEAEAEFESGLAAFRALGERWGMSGMLSELAGLADWRGDRERARTLFDEALDLFGKLGAAEDVADLLCVRAEGLVRSGDLAAARAEYERAAESARRSGAPEKLAGAHRGLGEVARHDGDLAGARRLLTTALAECAEGSFGSEWARAHVLTALGRLAEAEGNADEATSWQRQALALALTRRVLPVAAVAVEGLAGVALLEGRAGAGVSDPGERAALLLGAGTALRGMAVAGDPDVARVASRARELIGDEAYTAAYERGAALTHDDALALAAGPDPPL
jgi:predicted ATPase/DNA-binding SARP family transcriptional activator